MTWHFCLSCRVSDFPLPANRATLSWNAAEVRQLYPHPKVVSDPMTGPLLCSSTISRHFITIT